MKRAPILALLRRLEWRGDGYTCPDCENHHRDGHAPLCELDSVLNPTVGLVPFVAPAISKTETPAPNTNGTPET